MIERLAIAPLRVEAAALRQPGLRVERCGVGRARARAAARRLAGDPAGMICIAGFGGALDDGLRPGDVVVADEVRDESGASAPCDASIADALRSAGLTVAVAPIVSSPGLVRGTHRGELGRTGARAADMESFWLAPLGAGRRLSVVRVIVDTPSRELTNALSTVAGGARALSSLRRIGRVLAGRSDQPSMQQRQEA